MRAYDELHYSIQRKRKEAIFVNSKIRKVKSCPVSAKGIQGVLKNPLWSLLIKVDMSKER